MSRPRIKRPVLRRLPLRPKARRIAVGVAQVLVTLGILGFFAWTFGSQPFRDAGGALTWWSVPSAIAIGFVGTAMQALRWRLVSDGYGMVLEPRAAVSGIYESSFLNAILPGGVAGDAIRAVRQRGTYHASWTGSIGSVAGERLAGTVVVALAAGAALASITSLWSWAAFGAAVALAVIAWPSLRRLPVSRLLAVAGLSVAGWAAFAGLFVLAAVSTAAGVTAMHVLALSALSIAGMSIPLSVGGWGPREGVTALAFMTFGYSGAAGLTTAVGYGLLALISVLPGGLLLGVALIQRRAPLRASARREGGP